MIEHKEMPKSGQFVAVWEYNGKIWCNTHIKHDDGSMTVFCENTNDFEVFHSEYSFPEPDQKNVRYFTYD